MTETRPLLAEGAPAPPTGPIRVLVADGHEMVAESLVRLLSEDPSITVIGAAPTGGAVIATAAAKKPDIVVMDSALPDMDGTEAARTLLAETAGVEVILLSGSDTPGAYHAAREAGCAAWVNKTTAVRDLVAAVHEVYEGRFRDAAELVNVPPLDQLVIHYQPVVSLDTSRVVGFEALVRWDHPTHGLVYPGAFLPAAEHTGFILELGRFVGDKAVRQLREWQTEFGGDPPLWVGVNLSASGLAHPGLVEWVTEALGSSGLHPSSLVIEVTEEVLVDDATEAVARLRALKDLGVRIALDVFGTAFSSLAYLRRFPFDIIKIDTTLTAELPHARRSLLLVESIIHLSEMFSVTCIAEGIERADQAECLRAAGWHYGQGYLYSPPVAPDSIAMFLKGAGTVGLGLGGSSEG